MLCARRAPLSKAWHQRVALRPTPGLHCSCCCCSPPTQRAVQLASAAKRTSGTVKPSISTSLAGKGLLGLLPPAACSAFIEAVRATLPMVSTLILHE